MPPNDSWWYRQFVENMKEAATFHASFRLAAEPNIDDLDKAVAIYKISCQAYALTVITFEEFIDFGKSLRTRQALTCMEEKEFRYG